MRSTGTSDSIAVNTFRKARDFVRSLSSDPRERILLLTLMGSIAMLVPSSFVYFITWASFLKYPLCLSSVLFIASIIAIGQFDASQPKVKPQENERALDKISP